MPASEAKIKANTRYNKKAYDRIELKLRKDSKINGDFIRAHAEAGGESVNGFLLRAAIETIERDNISRKQNKEV